jgi:holo-[acyl-carrier protein] synthase
MIYGIGTDIVKIDRIRIAAEKWGDSFVEKILTPREILYCYGKNDPYPSLAVRFAAKEALIKAIGGEVTVRMKDIEVLNDTKGRPSIEVSNQLKAFFEEKKIAGCHLSLSHEKEFGVASVVLEV